MKLSYDTNFAAWECVLDSELILFLAKNYKADNDADGSQKEQLKMAMLKTNIDEQILKHSVRIRDGRATYATLLAEIKQIWAKGEKQAITSDDLPDVKSRDDWSLFKDRATRLEVVGYTDSILIELLRAKLSDITLKNMVQSKEFRRMNEVVQFMDKMEWPDQTATLKQPDTGKGKNGGRRPIKCYSCGKMGHIARFCWNKEGASKNDGNPSPEQ